MDDNTFRQVVQDGLVAFLKEMDCEGNVEKQMQQKQEFISSLRDGPIAVPTSNPSEDTYNLPTKLVKLCLGKRMKCSCCLFTTGEESLDEAEEAMLDLVCKRSELEDGMKVMDLGCGWGALTFWILEKYKDCHVTSVSDSKPQKMYIDSLAKEKGVTDQVNCITADVNDFDTTEKFDRVISIGMFEYMENYELLMAKIAKWLKTNGTLFTHIPCHVRHAYSSMATSKVTGLFAMDSKAFGSINLSPDLLLYFQQDLVISKHWTLSGIHFSKTAERWLQNIDKNRAQCLEIFSEMYGKEKAESCLTEWRIVLLLFEAFCGFNKGREWIFCHQLFRKRS